MSSDCWLCLDNKSINCNGRALIVVRDGDAPKGELACNNIVKVRTLLGLDGVFEVIVVSFDGFLIENPST